LTVANGVLYFADIASPRTILNLRRNPAVEIIDPAWVLLKYAAERSSSTRWIMWTCASCQQQRKKSAAGKWWGYATAA
jgi:hypothetical protein